DSPLHPRTRPRNRGYGRQGGAEQRAGPCRPRREVGLQPHMGRRAPQHGRDRQRRHVDRHRPYRRRHEHHPGRCRRHHAAEPRALHHRRAVRNARAALSGADRPGARPSARHRPDRRAPDASDRFPQDVLELQAFLAPAQPDQRIIAVPAAGTNVPLWILGSSAFGASMAAEFGLPYAFASHFAPALLMQALDIYRSRFKPSEQLDRPYAMAGINVIAADTDAEARRLWTTQQMSFADLFVGRRGLSKPPIDDIESYWSPHEKAQAMNMLSRSVVGSPETVRAGLEAFIAETGVDELMIVSDVYDHQDRLRSIELIAEATKA